eukprot:gnl/Ergobibamus_cyprinoides/3974.p1 GENE.gnl/Ergobibamus_cyprinoides/3974~~gnl/Ergobibamus_cyprinoides/3974.p1  ORF type:complete len:350 (+),score=54.19 gnl/Ergobibamus_cyprinoides/3974:109-1050(+)
MPPGPADGSRDQRLLTPPSIRNALYLHGWYADSVSLAQRQLFKASLEWENAVRRKEGDHFDLADICRLEDELQAAFVHYVSELHELARTTHATYAEIAASLPDLSVLAEAGLPRHPAAPSLPHGAATVGHIRYPRAAAYRRPHFLHVTFIHVPPSGNFPPTNLDTFLPPGALAALATPPTKGDTSSPAAVLVTVTKSATPLTPYSTCDAVYSPNDDATVRVADVAHMIPLLCPMLHQRAWFIPVGRPALALYPGTSSLYPAKVLEGPSRANGFTYVLDFGEPLRGVVRVFARWTVPPQRSAPRHTKKQNKDDA